MTTSKQIVREYHNARMWRNVWTSGGYAVLATALVLSFFLSAEYAQAIHPFKVLHPVMTQENMFQLIQANIKLNAPAI